MVLTNYSITTWHISEKNKPNFEAMPGGCRHQSPPQEPKITLTKCAHQLTVIDLLGRNLRLFALSVQYTKLFSAELKVILFTSNEPQHIGKENSTEMFKLILLLNQSSMAMDSFSTKHIKPCARTSAGHLTKIYRETSMCTGRSSTEKLLEMQLCKSCSYYKVISH